MSRTRRLVAVLAMLVAAMSSTLVVASPALAASCWADSCNYLDPQTNGCSSDAGNIQAIDPEGWYDVELRYSPSCYAAWARAKSRLGGGGGPRYHYLKLQVWSAASGGTLLRVETRHIDELPPAGQSVWTAMHSYGNYVQACIKDANDFGWCTGRF
ncbi:uncharacterized protein DUF2690 [Asanoa ferruginea]|uniref:Uncharacterized protein DUF2690 n=1 Tax=Asanoa ferruginea TaxID=53367 RepID=A0A3D9ZRE0_9ACTN|nr:DUF2690 domain-containing protein [Asanoa ferruginea]REF99449.1 uncharacterized protein DUF2690 [Asanoa ferruginea]GIF49381.1 hypothetical protein Afe04nite_39200 [Asanoa ferruginea]